MRAAPAVRFPAAPRADRPGRWRTARLREWPADDLDAIRQSALARHRQGERRQPQVVDRARVLDDPAHGRLQLGPAADVELGNGGQRIGKDRQDGDVDAREGLIERALHEGAARPQGGEMVDSWNVVADLQACADLRAVVVGSRAHVGRARAEASGSCTSCTMWSSVCQSGHAAGRRGSAQAWRARRPRRPACAARRGALPR